MITLTSDFPAPYPAAMKAAILQSSRARLVDIAHDLPAHDIRATGFWLREILPEFPPATHLVVVDPGVGTDRSALVVRVGEHALVGPDNGVLRPVARALSGTPEYFTLEYDDPDSATFHGRDVFAPAAGAVHDTGVDQIESLADVHPIGAADAVELRFSEPIIEESTVRGDVLVVDGFGTAITNIPGRVLEGHVGASLSVDGTTVAVERTYADVQPGAALLTVGSHGNVELAANRARGADVFGVDVGSTVSLEGV